MMKALFPVSVRSPGWKNTTAIPEATMQHTSTATRRVTLRLEANRVCTARMTHGTIRKRRNPMGSRITSTAATAPSHTPDVARLAIS
jgi:hypothetical protein